MLSRQATHGGWSSKNRSTSADVRSERPKVPPETTFRRASRPKWSELCNCCTTSILRISACVANRRRRRENMGLESSEAAGGVTGSTVEDCGSVSVAPRIGCASGRGGGGGSSLDSGSILSSAESAAICLGSLVLGMGGALDQDGVGAPDAGILLVSPLVGTGARQALSRSEAERLEEGRARVRRSYAETTATGGGPEGGGRPRPSRNGSTPWSKWRGVVLTSHSTYSSHSGELMAR